MKIAIFLAISAIAVLGSPVAGAHDVPNMSHSHAFEQTGYGRYRQGHYVNGPQGSIIIWSSKPKGSYQSAETQNARPKGIPSPYQKHSYPVRQPDSKFGSSTDYGKTTDKNYGK